MHGIGLFAFLPRFFSWPMLAVQFLLYRASGMGITYSYHRQLAHKSFKSPKWLEYLASTCGMMAFQGSPYEWVSDQYARARTSHLAPCAPIQPSHTPPLSLSLSLFFPSSRAQPVPPPAHRDAARPALLIRGLLLVAPRLDARQ